MIIIEKARKHFANHLPFVLYRNPNDNILKGVFQLNNHLYPFTGQNGFIMQSFNHKTSCCLPLDFSTNHEEIIIDNHLTFEYQKVALENTPDAQSFFEEMVKKAKEQIENKALKKVVLSREITLQIDQNFDVFKSFTNALKTYTDAFVYIFYHPKIGGWLGATPELLIKSTARNFETMSLAGTKIAQENTQWTLKEKNEQSIVTEFIVNILNDYCINLNVSQAVSKQAGQLLHLHSLITGSLNENITIVNLLKVLHPTPAVAGFPKKEAIKFISVNENYNRTFYTGFIGLYSVYKCELYVNLRCLNFQEKYLIIFVGCGITKDSQPAKEFEETTNKSKTMLQIL